MPNLKGHPQRPPRPIPPCQAQHGRQEVWALHLGCGVGGLMSGVARWGFRSPGAPGKRSAM